MQKRVDRTKKGVENVSPTTPGMKQLMTIRDVVKHGNNTLTLTLNKKTKINFCFDSRCIIKIFVFL